MLLFFISHCVIHVTRSDPANAAFGSFWCIQTTADAGFSDLADISESAKHRESILVFEENDNEPRSDAGGKDANVGSSAAALFGLICFLFLIISLWTDVIIIVHLLIIILPALFI